MVLVNGARQCGKSTLVAQIGSAHGAEWRSLDRAATRRAAAFDPTEFVASPVPLVIDEVQRVPELLLAIKEAVDVDPRPGRFLLTGSARVLSLRSVPDALPGRFLDSYVADLINRDVIQLSEIERGPEMRALTRLVAARSGQLLVPGALGNELGLPQPTIKRYLGLLEEVFLIKRIPAWSREMYHYRTKDKVEVEVVLENRRGQVVAIEVKAASTVKAEDFRGVRHLAARLGSDLMTGIVLYTGQQTLPFGPRFRAVPISALWEMPSPHD